MGNLTVQLEENFAIFKSNRMHFVYIYLERTQDKTNPSQTSAKVYVRYFWTIESKYFLRKLHILVMNWKMS